MFVLLLVVYIGGVPPAVAVEVHDFQSKEVCEESAKTVQAMVRTQLRSGGEVVWRCVEAADKTRVRVGEGVVPALLQSPAKATTMKQTQATGKGRDEA